MIIRDVNLETVCGVTSTFPEHTNIEIAFAGKSNVGKSSLINGLMNRKNLARTSQQPGKTQTINFYKIDSYQSADKENRVLNTCYFVDLPGYGYARANEEIKAKWGKMIEDYLHQSKMIKVVFLLIDIRHEPSTNDKIMYDWILNQGYEPVIIATKADKISRGAIPKHVKMIKTGLNVVKGTIVFPFSALDKAGRDEIYAYIDGLLTEESNSAFEL